MGRVEGRAGGNVCSKALSVRNRADGVVSLASTICKQLVTTTTLGCTAP